MPRKILTIAAAVAMAALGGTAMTTLGTEWAARREVAALLATHPGLRVGGVDVDAFGERVTLRDVALVSGALRVRAGRLDLALPAHPFALVAPAFAQNAPAGTASASDVTIAHGTTTILVKKIDLTGTTLGNGDLAALLDPKSPDTLAARLQKFRAETVAVSELTSTRKLAGGDARTSLTQIALGKVADGRIGTAAAASSSVALGDPRTGTSLKTGTIQATGVDLALLERMVDSVRADDAEPLRPLADAATVNDVSIVNADKKTTIGFATVAQKGLKARPFKTDPFKLGEAPTGDSVTDKAARAERTKAFLDDFGGSVEIATFSVERATLANSDAAGSGKLAAAAIAVEGYRDRKLGTVKLRDFAFEGPSARVAFGALDLADIAFPPPGLRPNDPGLLATDAYPSIGRGDLTALAVDVTTPQEDRPASRVAFKVAHIGSTGEREAGRYPKRGDFTVDHLTFDVATGEGAATREFAAMGYGAVDLSGAVATTFDRQAQTLAVQKLLVSGVDMGSMTFALDLANVSPNILSANPSLAKASAFSMLLKRVDLRLTNSGLVERALKHKAERDGRSLAEERRTEMDLFSVSLPQGMGNGPGIRAIGAAVASFIADPKTLHIGIRSKDGLGASDIGLIGSPDDLLSKLDIQAEANK